MGKKRRQQDQETKPAVIEEPAKRKFVPKDLLCVAAAVLFMALWLANQYVEAIPGFVVIGVYVAVAMLLGIYFLTGEKFLNLWHKWDIHKKIYFFILILADIIALFAYDIAGNILAIIILFCANYFYYLIFLRVKEKTDNKKGSGKYRL